jgi:peptide/nickel transport system ATP-binding protein
MSTAGLNTPLPPDIVADVRDLKAWYRTSRFGVNREVKAVDGVSLVIRRDEIYGLAGESSCGKSTLIKTIAGAIRPPLEIVDGSIRFAFMDGISGLHNAPDEVAARVRWRHLSYIMQGSMSVLNPLKRVRATFQDFAYRHLAGSSADKEAIVVAHLKRVALEPHVLDAFPHELSGGMRQRVTIALATVCRPEFIIADEPTTALDVVVQKDVLAMIRSIQVEMRASVLFVTHDLGVHAHLTDRLGIMYAGRIVEEAPTRQIFAMPRHPYTRHLIESLPRIGDTKMRKGLDGAPPNLAAPPPGCRFHPRCPIARDICRSVTPAMQTFGPEHRVACHFAEGGHA